MIGFVNIPEFKKGHFILLEYILMAFRCRGAHHFLQVAHFLWGVHYHQVGHYQIFLAFFLLKLFFLLQSSCLLHP